MRVEIQDNATVAQKEWDTLVLRSPHASIFHTSKFLKVAEKHSRGKLHQLCATADGQVEALLPVFHMRKGPFNLIMSPPAKLGLPYLGPLFPGIGEYKQSKRDETISSMQKSLHEYIKTVFKPDYVFVLNAPSINDMRQYKRDGYSLTPMYNYHLPLVNGVKQIWGEFRKHHRNDITRALKAGVTIEEGKKADIPNVASVIRQIYSGKGLEFSPTNNYLNDLYDSLGDAFRIFIVKYHGEVLGGTFTLFFKEGILYWQGGVLKNNRGLALNDVMLWEIIQIATNESCTVFDLGGANTEGITEFKSKYNPTLEIYFLATKGTILGKFASDIYGRLKR